MTNLTIGADTFRVEVTGDPTRPAVMMSHALGTDLSLWDGQVAALAAHFRVIRYDARGHGGSRGGGGPVSIADHGRDVLAILDALEIETVHWVGLSMGGTIGMWLLAHATARITRAVLANTAPKIGTPEGWNERIVDVLATGMDGYATTAMARWFSPAFAAREPARVARIRDLVRGTDAKGYAASCAALRDVDLREALHGIETEVLVISGTADPVVPPADAEAFLAALPGARHVALVAQHLSNIEAEADFNAAVTGFLTAKPAARPKTVSPVRAKTAVGKRSGAARRSNAARAPLKAPAKRSAAKKASAGATKKKRAAAHRRPATKKITARRAAPVAATTKRTPKATRKAASARRRPAADAARGAAKAPTRKAKSPKAGAPTTKKTPRKTATKKAPAGRRKTTTKPRRPTGRRKR